MAIITISRGSYSRGKEVAEQVARRLGYACISRDILLDASEIFNVPEIKLIRAIHDAPSLLERFSNGPSRYVTYIEAALLRFFKEDNVVYHGLAGHFFVQGVGHALKVRITADLQDRVHLEMEREKIAENEARHVILKDDEQRRRWSRSLYGIDTSDPSLYDLGVHIRHLRVEDAVEIICHTVGLERFRPTAASRQALTDLALAAEVKAVLTDRVADLEVRTFGGQVRIQAKIGSGGSDDESEELKWRALQVRGVTSVKLDLMHKARFVE